MAAQGLPLVPRVLLLLGCLSIIAPSLVAQDIQQVEAPLIDQQPFDLITLTADEGGAQVKVFPIPFPNRQIPADPRPTDTIEVVLKKYPDRRYEIAWRAIARIDLYEQMIYDEALEKLQQKEFATAFQNLSYLLKNYPDLPRLDSLRQEFVFQSALDRYRQGELRQTLSAFEELRESDPDFRTEDILSGLSNVADALITEYQQRGDLGSAKALLSRLRAKYGNTLRVVGQWAQRLEQLALAKKDEASELISEGKYREARKAVIEMMGIFPKLEEGQELIDEINRLHPMVRVGVMQRSGEMNPSSLIDWAARRAGGLVNQPLFSFLETGTEGGRYGFSLGTFRLSDDRLQLILSIEPNVAAALDAFQLSQTLLQRADPAHPTYDPSWAAIFDSVSASTSHQVIAQLKRPNVLPYALMQWIVPGQDRADRSSPEQNNQQGALQGAYELIESTDNETVFKHRTPRPERGQPVELIEIFYDDPKEAVNDLLRGEIDILDQLFPADAKRLADRPGIDVLQYALPTTHMLIPVSEHPYLGRDKFRRALLYATNREAILTGELLNSTDPSDGRLVSGPFPLGDGEFDPLAYAYDPDIEPVEYNPYLARLLVVMSQKELQDSADRMRKPAPKLGTLLVGCPNFEFARVAVQAMIQQWALVGINAEMRVLPSGQLTSDHECDLIYAVTNMWEPATDIERLLGGNGIAATDNPFIVQALERLRFSRNWREVRDALQALHQLIDYHLPVIPLWQVTDRFAVREYVEGLENRPVSLYQSIGSWRVQLDARQQALQ